MNDVRNLVVFAGAGISRPAPSNLPLFEQMRDALLVAARVDPRGVPRDVLDGLAPERLFSILSTVDRDRRSVTAWMEATLSVSVVNANHRLAARVLRDGGTVWTTNFERLVERACALEGVVPHVWAWPEEPDQCACESGHLFKAHGSLPGPLIFTSEEVLKGLRGSWRRALERTIDGRAVCLAGYRGADLDLGPALTEALPKAAAATWYEFGGEGIDQLRERFPALPPSAFVAANPSVGLHGWCASAGVACGDLEAAVDAGPVGLPEVRSFSRLASGRLAAQLVGREAGRRHFAWSVVLGRGGERAKGLARLLESVLYDPGRAARPIGAATKAATSVPGLRRWPLVMRARLTFLEGRADKAAVLTEGERLLDMVPDDTEIRMRVATAAKLMGRRADAIRHAEEVRGHLIRGGVGTPSHIGWATFTVAFALRWAGHYERAAELAEELIRDYAGHGGPVWRAWGYFEKACQQALRGEAQASRSIETAIAILRQLGNEPARLDCETSRVTIDRADGRRSGLVERLAEVELKFKELGVLSDYRLAAIDLERAEIAFEGGDVESARRFAATVLAGSPSPEVRALARLVLARVAVVERGDADGAIRSARRESAVADFPFGVAVATVLDCMANGTEPVSAVAVEPGLTPDVRRRTVDMLAAGWDPIAGAVVFP